MDIAEIICGEISRRGLTPTEVSRGAGIPFSTVSEFIREGHDIGISKVSKLCDFLGIMVIPSVFSVSVSQDGGLCNGNCNEEVYQEDDQEGSGQAVQ